MQDLQGKIAVVTGAASGIGLATASRFAEEGMKVVLGDIQQDALEEAVSTLKRSGHDVLGVPVDVSQREDIQHLADQAIAAYGKVNIVHNNAGVVRAGTLEELTDEVVARLAGLGGRHLRFRAQADLPGVGRSSDGTRTF